MDLLALSKQINRPVDGQAILIHGDPGTGKTDLAGTIAKCPDIKEVHYFGLDNGKETLFTSLREGRLTSEAAEKIKIYHVVDTPDLPVAYETIFKALGTRGPVKICEAHGRCLPNCVKCEKDKAPFQVYDITKQDKTTATIIDTGSQLADSHMNYLCKGKPDDYKPGWDEFGPQGLKLAEILTLIQAGTTNWVFVTQSIGVNIVLGALDQIAKPEDKAFVEKVYPLCGSQAQSMKVGKYFGQKIYTKISNLGKFTAGSSVAFKPNAVIGSRTGWKIEAEKELSLHLLWERIKEQRK
jgi:hypothetical protein